MRFPVLGLFAALAVIFAACGEETKPSPEISPQQRGVLEIVDRLQTASRKGDGEQICSKIFTRQLAGSIEVRAKTSCAKEVDSKLFPPKTVLAVGQDVRFPEDGRAVATVIDQDNSRSTLFLTKDAGEWRIEKIKAGPQPSS